MDLKFIGWSIMIIMYQHVFLSEAWQGQYDESSYDDLTQQDDILSSKRLLKQLNKLRNLYRNNHQHSATSKSERNDAKNPNPFQTPRKQKENKSDKRNNNDSVQDASNNTVSMDFVQNIPKDEPKATVPLLEAANERHEAKSDAAMKLLQELLPGLFTNYLEQLKNNTNLKDVNEVLTTKPSSYNANEPNDSNESNDSNEFNYSNETDDSDESNGYQKEQQIKDEKNHDADISHDDQPTGPIIQIIKNPHPPPYPTTECPRETVYYPVPVYNNNPLPEYLNHNPRRPENNLPDTYPQTSPNFNPALHDMYANRFEMFCKSGSKWKRNCHECICNSPGSPICTKIEDCEIKPPGTPMQCKPYSKYDLDECNECECDGDGVPICTFLECPTYGPPVNIQSDNISKYEKNMDQYSFYKHPSSARFRVKIKQRYQEVCDSDSKLRRCAPGTRWQSECHECACNWKGKHNCVRLPHCYLSLSGSPGRCKPNTTFFDKCKRCSCDDEGTPICDNLCYRQ